MPQVTLPFLYRCRADSRLAVTTGAVVVLEAAKIKHPTYGPAQAVYITVEDNAIRRTYSGTTPTTGADGVGAIMNDGDSLLIQGGINIQNLKMISLSGNAVVQAEYFYEK